MKLSLSPETERRIKVKLNSGRYESADEVVREGLELLDKRDKAGVAPAFEEGKGPLTLYELFQPIWSSVPDAEWEKLPPDLSVNLDHYLYGAPKESE